jgi:hypothetical protein
VYKQEGSSFALLVFAASEGRDSFVSGFNAAQQSLNAANSGMTLLLPGDRVPEETVGQLNGKRKRELPARKVRLLRRLPCIPTSAPPPLSSPKCG